MPEDASLNDLTAELARALGDAAPGISGPQLLDAIAALGLGLARRSADAQDHHLVDDLQWELEGTYRDLGTDGLRGALAASGLQLTDGDTDATARAYLEDPSKYG